MGYPNRMDRMASQWLIQQYLPGYVWETAELVGISVPYWSCESVAYHRIVPADVSWDEARTLWRICRMWEYLCDTPIEEDTFKVCCDILHVDSSTVEEFFSAATVPQKFLVSPLLFLLAENITYIREDKGILVPYRFIPKDFSEMVMQDDRSALDYYFCALPPGSLSQFSIDKEESKRQ